MAFGLLLATHAAAQGELRWVARYDGPAHYIDAPRSMAVDESGFVYVAGSVTVNRPPYLGAVSQSDWLTLKYSPDGQLVWDRRFGEGRVFDEGASKLVVDDEGNVFVTGSAALPGSLRADFTTLKYDPDGELLWARHSFEGTSAWGAGIDIVLDGEGGVVVTGFSVVNSVETQSLDIVTVRHDTDGNILWQRTFGSPESGPDRAWALARTPAGDYVVTGQVAAAPGWLGEKSCDVVTIKYDGLGRLQWVRRYDGLQSALDRGLAIQAGASGNIYVTGETQSGSLSWYGADSITLAYSPEGALLWARRFDGAGESVDITGHIAVDADENVFVGGFSMSPLGYPDTDYLVIRYDPEGRMRWAKTFTSTDEFKPSEQVSDLVLDSDGNLFATGDGTTGTWMTLRLSTADGSVAWKCLLEAPALGLSDPSGGMAFTSKGELVISGTATATTTQWPNYDFLTLRLQPE